MSEELNFLREDEKVLAQSKVVEVRRAHILASLNHLATTLQLSDEVAGTIIENARTKIEELTPKEIKKLGKATLETAHLFALLTAPDTTEEVENEVLHEIASLEIVAEGGAVPNKPEEESERSEGANGTTINPRAIHYLERIVGPTDDLELTTDDASAIASGLVMLRGTTRTSKRSYDYQAIFTDRFSNVSPNDMAARAETNAKILGVSLASFAKKVIETTTQEDAARLFRTHIAASRAHITAHSDKVDSEPQVDLVQIPPTKIEKLPEITPPTYLTVGEAWAERLDLNRQLQSALKEFLSPRAGVTLNKYKREAVGELVQYITRHFTTIDNEELNLTVSEKLVLRHLTGAWYTKTSGDTAERPINTMASVINKLRNAKPVDTIISDAMMALQKILDSDEDRLTRPDVRPVPTPPRTPLTFVKRDKVREDGAMNRQEWLAQTETSLVSSLMEGGISSEHAHALWQRFHFDAEGIYRQDTPVQRAAMADLQNLLVNTDLQKLPTASHVLTGIKMLSTAALGYKTLDDVLEKALEKDKTITQESLERALVDSLGRMVL